jgi:hypothetical protein
MANTEAAVDWAAARGANGVEADLRFDETGKPLESGTVVSAIAFAHSVGRASARH